MASRVDHWDRDRFAYERDRDRFGGERRERFEEHDHHYRGPGGGGRVREHSDERYDRRPRAYDDEFVRDRRYYEEEPRFVRSPREPTTEHDRRVFFEKDREREVVREASPAPRRPTALLRRQSSLDTFDRRPARSFFEREREEYGPPARIERVQRVDDFRAPAYVPIPLPRTRALPPPRRFADQQYYDEIKIAEPELYGDEEYRSYPDRIREREVVRTSRKRRGRSRDSMTSKTYSRRSSRSSSVTSRSSSRSRATTARNEYPKKGKTRIPTRLVSKRALIDLGYPFIEEGNTTVVLKALGQDNIDELLKLSEDYKKSELEISAARSSAGGIVEERREEIVIAPPPATTTVVEIQRPSAPAAPVVITAAPPAAPVELVKQTVVRDISPSRSTSTYTTTTAPSIYDGELALRPRSRSRSGRELRAEIRALEAELRDRRRPVVGSELVRAERLSDGQLVMYEERVEKVDEGHRGPRIEKDKKGPPPGIIRAMLATLT